MSRCLTFRAFCSMNSRRSSTLSPMRTAKASSASIISPRVTCTRVRLDSSIVVSHSCSAFISPRPLYRWMLSAGAFGHDGFDETGHAGDLLLAGTEFDAYFALAGEVDPTFVDFGEFSEVSELDELEGDIGASEATEESGGPESGPLLVDVVVADFGRFEDGVSVRFVEFLCDARHEILEPLFAVEDGLVDFAGADECVDDAVVHTVAQALEDLRVAHEERGELAEFIDIVLPFAVAGGQRGVVGAVVDDEAVELVFILQVALLVSSFGEVERGLRDV